MAIERRLTELAGPVGGRLHTARSRNDQVATDVILYTRDQAARARERLAGLMETLLDVAERHIDWPMPGYTHLQRAQPVYLGHHLLAYFWMALRDRRRFDHVLEACALLPLGAGALAGVNFPTDREPSPASWASPASPRTRSTPSPTGTSCSTTSRPPRPPTTHLSRLGAELVLWSTAEFGFCPLPDAWSSGSSIMPQKRNPDAAELLRAKAPRVAGHLLAMHGVLHGLPLTYNKDLQEDKEHLFDAADTLDLCLAAARGMLDGVGLRSRPLWLRPHPMR